MPEARTRSLGSWRERARALKRDARALVLAYRDPRVPWYARLWMALTVAYAFSPIDFVPDPIPILGQLDDFILIPLAVAIAIRMIPAPVWEECRARAAAGGERPVSRAGAVLVVVLWLSLLLSLVWAAFRFS